MTDATSEAWNIPNIQRHGNQATGVARPGVAPERRVHPPSSRIPIIQRRSESALYRPVALVAICTFGPYLSSSIGIRTEQVALFGLLALAIPALLWRTRYSAPTIAALLCLVTVYAVGVMSWAMPIPIADTAFARAPVLAGLVNNFVPIAAILLTAYWLSTGLTRVSVFRVIARVFVWAMVANSVVAFVSVKVNMTGILHHFWQATSSVDYSNSVAVRAAVQGRFSGIFDQPTQAGIMYSLALFFAIYLADGWSGETPRRFAVIGPVLLVGGLLTVSKVFILLGVPLSVLLLLRRSRPRGPKLYATIGVPTVGLTLYLTGQLAGMQAIHKIGALIHPQGGEGVINLYSGGRLGSGGTLGSAFHLVATESPISGFGLGGLVSVPLDSMWLAAAVTAGYIGIVLWVAVTLLLVVRYLQLRHADPTRGLMFSIVALIIGSSLGFPVLIGNRISTLLWIVLTVLLLSDQPWEGHSRMSTVRL